jgi:hypothetical protein
MRWWASLSYRSASSAMRHRSAPSRGRRPSADHRQGRQRRGWAGRPSPRQERRCPPWLKTGRGRRPGRDVRCVLYRAQMPVLRSLQERVTKSLVEQRAAVSLASRLPTTTNRQQRMGRPWVEGQAAAGASQVPTVPGHTPALTAARRACAWPPYPPQCSVASWPGWYGPRVPARPGGSPRPGTLCARRG